MIVLVSPLLPGPLSQSRHPDVGIHSAEFPRRILPAGARLNDMPGSQKVYSEWLS
jgi:hypothetical protein